MSTPGPWHVEHLEVPNWSGQYPHIFGANGLCVAVVREQDPAETEIANAHLLAAAPEMLDLLRDLADCSADGDLEHVTANDLIERARSLVAKAAKG